MIPLPREPKINKKDDNEAVFEIEALYPGYGVTVGNALRRVLLSSLEGSAVTEFKVKDVPHEFTTIPGVKEDVVQIMLNLKQLRFKMFADEPQTATLKVKGEKKVTGKDLDLPSQLELVNEDAHIATLTEKKAELDMQITVEKGIGYVTAEERKKEKLDVGTMLVDAAFTPVRQVSFKVKNMRVGKRTDFDKLSIEVKTDGTITPKEALAKSCGILSQHFNLFCGGLGEAKKEKEESPAEEEKESKEKKSKPKDEKKKKGKKTK